MSHYAKDMTSCQTGSGNFPFGRPFCDIISCPIDTTLPTLSCASSGMLVKRWGVISLVWLNCYFATFLPSMIYMPWPRALMSVPAYLPSMVYILPSAAPSPDSNLPMPFTSSYSTIAPKRFHASCWAKASLDPLGT